MGCTTVKYHLSHQSIVCVRMQSNQLTLAVVEAVGRWLTDSTALKRLFLVLLAKLLALATAMEWFVVFAANRNQCW